MFVKMRESKGFTLVELMIVVAIIGILAAVAVPYYQKYIQKSRLTSKVFPGVHSIETNIATYYSFQQKFPSTMTTFSADANTSCFGEPTASGATLTFTIRGTDTTCKELKSLNGLTLVTHPKTASGKIVGWELTGTLADQLGLTGEK